ncbi:N-acetylglucosamine kinase [Kribbella deserti]|uniref:N-acetylglucosamine kinase n=1 Tax=Kribbella deserti TaxID=1926257 RepID=A0ABV6QQR7_9ACTN
MITVAVDGGQSSLRLKILPDGVTGWGPGYVHGRNGVQAIVDAVRRAADQAGLDGRPVAIATLGLTGYPGDAAARQTLANGLARVLHANEVRLCGDMVTAHAGALPAGYGVVVAAGTGTVCLAVDRDGSWHQVDGHGYLFGDAGSAFAIGRAGIVAAQRARDGRATVTTLAEVSASPAKLYTSTTVVADVARFAPVVLRCAALGDIVAQGIVAGAVADLAETISTGVRALRGTDRVPVACVGGLFAAGEQLLGPLRSALDSRALLTPPAGASLDGAQRLTDGEARQYAGLIDVYHFDADPTSTSREP